MTTEVAFSGAVAKAGVPHSGQNTCARRLPLCAPLPAQRGHRFLPPTLLARDFWLDKIRELGE